MRLTTRTWLRSRMQTESLLRMALGGARLVLAPLCGDHTQARVSILADDNLGNCHS